VLEVGLQLRDRGDLGLGEAPVPRQGGAVDRGVEQHGERLDVAGQGVGQLGAVAQLRVVDHQGHASGAVEEGGDELGVAVEDLVRDPQVGEAVGDRGGVDVRPQLVERVEPVERGAERLGRHAATPVDLLAEGVDGGVGLGSGLVVALHRDRHRVLLTDELDGHPGPLVLQGGDDPRRADGRPGEVCLLDDPVGVPRRPDDLHHGERHHRAQRYRQRHGHLPADRHSHLGPSARWGPAGRGVTPASA
jgi:hypothetical protein